MEFSIIRKDVTGSTSEDLRTLAQEGASEGTVVVARRQESGHGQWGRTWVSPEGGLYFSVLLRPTAPQSEWAQLSPRIAEAVAGVVRAECAAPEGVVRVKLPNDVVCDQGKLCGILLEAKNGAVIVGCGVNVFRPHDPVVTDGRNVPAYMEDLGLPSRNPEVYLGILLDRVLGALQNL